MIAALTGELRSVEENRVYFKTGPLLYELSVSAADVPTLQTRVGEEMTLHTIFYLEGDSTGGSMDPRLIGFLRMEDKKFFEKFITVKGIGPKKALRALVYPAGQIAQAIEGKDTRFLVGLPQIGKRMAELIVAELAGKVAEFAIPYVDGKRGAAEVARRNPSEDEAIAVLIALGEKRLDAEHLLDRARQVTGSSGSSNDLVREMLRLRTARS